jgi:hypothetical protein
MTPPRRWLLPPFHNRPRALSQSPLLSLSWACALSPLDHGTLGCCVARVQRSSASPGCPRRDSRRLDQVDPSFNCSSLPRRPTGHTASLSGVFDRRQLIIVGGLCSVYETSSAPMVGREVNRLRHSSVYRVHNVGTLIHAWLKSWETITSVLCCAPRLEIALPLLSLLPVVLPSASCLLYQCPLPSGAWVL